jgi:hypothetical protein
MQSALASTTTQSEMATDLKRPLDSAQLMDTWLLATGMNDAQMRQMCHDIDVVTP